MKRNWTSVAWWAAFLVAAFAYRLGFGLCSEFFSDDESQIFLIGLRHHITGAWPYFGADVVWTQSQIPGALQGLLVGVPMDIIAQPEAPFVLLNLLSFGALALLAWYLTKRLPEVPRWLVWGWLFFIPWTLSYGTHVLNPDYVLAPAVLFFVGFFEALPRFRIGAVRLGLAHLMMGLAVFWIMQLHMSWPLLGPFVLVILIARAREGFRSVLTGCGWMLAGAAVSGAFLVPTFLKFGLAGAGGTHRNLVIQPRSIDTLVSSLARFFSFSSIEVPRFLGIDTAHRWQLLDANKWMLPVTAVAWFAGIVQPVWMAATWFRHGSRHAEWQSLKWLVAGSVVLVYSSYWFVIEPAQAHAFYLLAPLSFIYAFYCFSLFDSRTLRVVAGVLLVTTVIYNAGLATTRAPERSLYRNREVAATAMHNGTADVFGHRRPFAVEGAPVGDVFATGEEVSTLRLTDAASETARRGYLVWTLTLHNDSATSAYRDVAYDTVYRDTAGKVVGVHHDVLPDIVQPGESVTIKGINHGYVGQFGSAEMHVTRAHRLRPLKFAISRP